ncbi:hypothetical protein D3C86_770620 [compost metagenome]
MKGALGWRFCSLVWTLATLKSATFRASTMTVAAASEPISGFLPFQRTSSVVKAVLAAPFTRSALMDQYSLGTKAWTSASRSQIRRTATLWTRPADRPRRTFCHSRGEIL